MGGKKVFRTAVLILFCLGNRLWAGPETEPEIDRLRGEIASAVAQGNEKAAERSRIRLAELFMKEGRIVEAGRTWDSLTQLYFTRKERARLFALMGSCYEELKQYEKALPAYEQALFWAPKKWENHLALARVYGHVDLFEESIPYYENVLARKKDQFEALLGLAQVYAQLHYYDKSLSYYLEAQKVCPPEAKNDLLMALSRVYEHLGQFGQAVAALEETKSGPETLVELGSLYERQGLKDQSAAAYKKARAAGYSNPDLLVSMALVEFKRGRSSVAEHLLTEATAFPQERALAYFFRGYVRRQRGAWNEALADARMAKSLAGEQGLASYSEQLLDSLESRVRKTR